MKEHQQSTRKYKKTDVFKNGEYVMLRVQRSNKSEPSYTGPYQVVKRNDEGLYWLKSEEGKELAPANFLKRASKEAIDAFKNARKEKKLVTNNIDDNYEWDMMDLEGHDDLKDSSYDEPLPAKAKRQRKQKYRLKSADSKRPTRHDDNRMSAARNAKPTLEGIRKQRKRTSLKKG